MNATDQKHTKVLVRKSQGKRPHGRSRRRRKYNLILRKRSMMVLIRFNWSGQGPVVGSCDKVKTFMVPLKRWNFSTSEKWSAT
jgi:hypothetical protein